jgi:aspartyl-tRNA(Asn)/glutamyl-tRNA(Gln) amidotransferase subunit A
MSTVALADDLIQRTSVFALAADIRAGRINAVDLLAVSRRRVEQLNDELVAFVYLDWDAALAAAEAVDAAIARGEDVGALAGVPFAVKDTQDCAGMPTKYGSLLHADAAAAVTDEPYVARLRAAGAIPVGKTATPEFASGLLTESDATGTTRNPWNPALTPGGSSGGSAAAVASGMVPFATGSDGGGSIRIPASITGLVGYKTTFGVVPERDRALSQTSTVGVLTWDVLDTVRLVDIMSGPIAGDQFSAAVPQRKLEPALAGVDLRGLRVTYVPYLDNAGATDEVAAACRAAVDRLVADEGMVELDDVIELDAGANEIFVGAGSADPWSLFEFGDTEANSAIFSDYFTNRLAKTGAITMQEYGRFQQRRRQLRREIAEWFERVDVVIAPTLSTTEIPAEGPPPTKVQGQVYEGVAAVAPLTRIANLAGAPSVTVPVGIGANGAPIGLQVITAADTDDLALKLALALEAQGAIPAAARPF